MSRYIATRGIRGANAIVGEADVMLRRALKEKGPDVEVAFPNTAYFLPFIYAMTGWEIKTLGDLEKVIDHAKSLLHPVPSGDHWTPYLGEALDSGMATLFAEEVIAGVRFAYGLEPQKIPGLQLGGGTDYGYRSLNGAGGHANGPIDDIQLRSWGIQLVDGRMPGFAAIVGKAKNNETAVAIVRELQQRNILTFLCGNVNGRSIIHQLMEEGVELGYDTFTVPFGLDTISAIYPLGFASRSALTFGGLKGGQAREILLYNKLRVFAFVLALGEVDDLKYATAAGAINFGFPVVADTVIPQILPTGITDYEHVISMPFNEIEGKDDAERAAKLVQKCIEVRGVKIRVAEVPVPIAYGSAFEGEVVRRADMRIEFGGKGSRCFEYLKMVDMDAINDGAIKIVGPGIESVEDGGTMDMGIVVEVAGREMQSDFEPVLERQIHYFVNGGSGLQHIGQRDIAWIRISKVAFEKGFRLEHFGKILHARLHADFGAIVDKVAVTIYTDPAEHAKWLEEAREAYSFRNERLATLTDDAVDEFYSCTLCQSFAPDHVCIVSPERLGLCGAYNWLDCKASYQINPNGPNQPIRLGKLIDPVKGYWEGTLSYAKVGSHGAVQEVTMYSIMENPMTACGCFECIVMLIPEVQGVMVVSREDIGMTPAGMKFSTLAGIAGGGLQTPGVMGVGKFYLTSPKFISADGGFKRVVWMSKNLKDSMANEFAAVAEREEMPDLIDRIADGSTVETVEQLEEWLKAKDHPVLQMGPMQPGEGAPEVEAAAPAPVAVAEAEVEEVTFGAAKPPVVVEAEAVAFGAEEAKAVEPALPSPPPSPPPAPAAGAGDAVELLRRTLVAGLTAALRELGADVSAIAPAAPVQPAAPAAPAPAVEPAAPPAPAPKPEPKIEMAPDQVWLAAGTKTALAKEQWAGSVRTVTIGATAAEGGTRTRTLEVGGQTAMPYLDFDTAGGRAVPNPPALGVEIKDRRPDDWSPLLLETWGDAMDDPAKWAKAAEAAGADFLLLTLTLTGTDGNPKTPQQAVAAVKKVLEASGLPLFVFGPGQADADNALLVPIAEATKGERLVLGLCEEKNYRTIAAAAMANGHLVDARASMDVNLSKQLNIMLGDMGIPMDRIIMDPTTAAVGYGFEYGFSVMERLRLAALQGDGATQMPILCTPGEEAWRIKESKVGEGVPEAWGNWEERAINFETLTAVGLVEAGADLLVLRHPTTLKRVRAAIKDLLQEV
ncbi:MAG: CO dehydrogenase/CO-methylating acetyl-CoA synthase complex subunit beta [Anaerolineae bacterium]|nr:CO dehydrogenase/CO-methylating acetyl-CoA synthase complex subunit beta [Anaerolineae bacterium]